MAAIPPAELQYQLDHKDDDASRQLAAFFISCMVLSAFFVAVRLVSRKMMKLGVQVDDYTILAGLVWISTWTELDTQVLITTLRSLQRVHSSSCSSTVSFYAPFQPRLLETKCCNSVRRRTGKALGDPHAGPTVPILKSTY